MARRPQHPKIGPLQESVGKNCGRDSVRIGLGQTSHLPPQLSYPQHCLAGASRHACQLRPSLPYVIIAYGLEGKLHVALTGPFFDPPLTSALIRHFASDTSTARPSKQNHRASPDNHGLSPCAPCAFDETRGVSG